MSIEKLTLTTPDFTDEAAARIAELFPNVVTEGRDEDGTPRRMIDFDLLKQELSADIVDGPTERYHLNWPVSVRRCARRTARLIRRCAPCGPIAWTLTRRATCSLKGIIWTR